MSTYNLSTFNTLFLQQKDLTDLTMIRDDVDMSVLTPTIRLVQDYYLYKLLGSNLYVDLQGKIQAGTLNQDELTLCVIYILPTMAWGCMKVAPIFMSYKYTNRGIGQMSGTDVTAANMADIQYLAGMANQYYELYADRLVKYLIANASLFPAYRVMNAYNDVAPATDGWNPRISLGNRMKHRDIQHEPGGTNNINITTAMIAYFNVSKIATAFSHTANTAQFSGSFLAAPSGLPGTSAANFTFYDNSTLIPSSAVTGFVDNGNGTCSLSVDTSILGYNFQINDVISSAGKYQ